jgi:site-specific recombinase XerD
LKDSQGRTRQAFASTLLHCGVDLRTIADISGHDVATMLKHYAHSISASRQDAISQLPTLHPAGAENDTISNNSKGNE